MGLSHTHKECQSNRYHDSKQEPKISTGERYSNDENIRKTNMKAREVHEEEKELKM